MGKAQNGQHEGHTYLLCSTNSLHEGKRETEKAKERACHLSCPLLVLHCFQPEACPCLIASQWPPGCPQSLGALSQRVNLFDTTPG